METNIIQLIHRFFSNIIQLFHRLFSENLELSMAAANLGFSMPSIQMITDAPHKKNHELIERKKAILTELAAIESGINIFDFIDPARNNLLCSVTDVPCAVEVLSSPQVDVEPLNVQEASQKLAQLIVEIGQNPSKTSYEVPRKEPRCKAIVKHAKVFFAQQKAIEEIQSGIKTAFCVFPKIKQEIPSAGHLSPSEPENSPDQKKDYPYSEQKKDYPYYPEVYGLNANSPLTGLMKQQLGELPPYIRNPPDNDELDELLLQVKLGALEEHILDICGNSSDDDFDPDFFLNH